MSAWGGEFRETVPQRCFAKHKEVHNFKEPFYRFSGQTEEPLETIVIAKAIIYNKSRKIATLLLVHKFH